MGITKYVGLGEWDGKGKEVYTTTFQTFQSYLEFFRVFGFKKKNCVRLVSMVEDVSSRCPMNSWCIKRSQVETSYQLP